METQYRISGGGEFLIRAFAWSVYCANFLIEIITDWMGVGLFISPFFMGFSFLALALMFKSKGVKLIDQRTGGQFITSAVISLIPIVNILYFKRGKMGIPLPGIVALTSKIIATSQEEDEKKTNNSEEKGYQRPNHRPNNRDSNRYASIEEQES